MMSYVLVAMKSDKKGAQTISERTHLCVYRLVVLIVHSYANLGAWEQELYHEGGRMHAVKA